MSYMYTYTDEVVCHLNIVNYEVYQTLNETDMRLVKRNKNTGLSWKHERIDLGVCYVIQYIGQPQGMPKFAYEWIDSIDFGTSREAIDWLREYLKEAKKRDEELRQAFEERLLQEREEAKAKQEAYRAKQEEFRESYLDGVLISTYER